MIFSGGAIGVKLLKRTANFSTFKKQLVPAANSRDIKLLIPKKSKLIIEQSLRERQYSKGKKQNYFFHKLFSVLSLI